MGYGVKLFGKWEHQLDYPLAIYNFRQFWMPYCAPWDWEESWTIFLDGLYELDWISSYQRKRWKKPDFDAI